MDFKTLCKARYSVRAYKPDAIPAETMDYIKECTRLAPSAVNKQPWKFILFTGEDDRTHAAMLRQGMVPRGSGLYLGLRKPRGGLDTAV